jgi:Ca2+/Na+ antiporter
MYKRIVSLLASKVFFAVILIISILQAVWLAMVSRYPMAFDEAHHYEVIQLHSKKWGPLILEQPPGPALYGALVRDPSYVYHYLLSFPYRLLESLGFNDQTIILSLRYISIALFAVGLVLFRHLLLKTKASAAAVHTALLFFILIPTVPLLAGQLNYDNLQFPLMALAMILMLNYRDKLQKKKFSVTLLVTTLVVCIVGTLNKFTFLPIITAVTIYLIYVTAVYYAQNKKRANRTIKKEWLLLPRARKWLLGGSLALAIGFFLWSYGINIALYKNPVPPCHFVLGKDQCAASWTWARNDLAAATNPGVDKNPVTFSTSWLGNMHYRLFFTINGATGPKKYENHTALGITIAAATLAIIGALLLVRYGKPILRSDHAFVAILFVVFIYFASVWGRNYNDFLHLGQPLAVNGRYLQPLLPPFILLLIAAYQRALYKRPNMKLALLIVSFVLFLSGGGITGFIYYSDADWYPAGNVLINEVQLFARKIVAPLFLWQ